MLLMMGEAWLVNLIVGEYYVWAFVYALVLYIFVFMYLIVELYRKRIAKVFGLMLLYIIVFIYTSCKNSLSSVHSISPTHRRSL